VMNQIVPASAESTATSSTGVVSVSDAVAGDALALKMTAPRSVVMNQLVQNGDFSNGTTGWTATRGSISVSNGVLVFAGNQNYSSSYFIASSIASVTNTHTYLVALDIKFLTAVAVNLGMSISNNSNNISNSGDAGLPTVDNWTMASCKLTATATSNVNVKVSVGFTTAERLQSDICQVRQFMVVDLTQYFNGDSTLISSITSWDDLVAYDPRFAEYVQYNMGTVTGVQPQVKVTGKNLLPYNTVQTFFEASVLSPDRFYRRVTVSGLNPDQQYTFSLNSSYSDDTYAGRMYLRGRVLTSDAPWTYIFRDTTGTKSVTGYPDRQGNIHVEIYKGIWDGGYSGYISNIQLELGSVATAYEPYFDGGTATAPEELFAVGTAADEFEAVAGVTTRKCYSMNTQALASIFWSSDVESESGYIRFIGDMSPNTKAYGVTNVCSNYFVTSTAIIPNNPSSEAISGYASGAYVYIGIKTSRLTGDLTTLAGRRTAFQNWIIANNLEIYYELDTPTTTQSTPTQISLQAGSNVAMQTDGGRTLEELSMTYENLPTD